MRLNRGSAIFMAILAIAVVVSLILLNSNDEQSNNPTPAATSSTVALFPNVFPSNVTAITISATENIGDTRPTPIPGNPTLVPPTDLPEGQVAPTTTSVIALSKDEAGTWVSGSETTNPLTGAIDAARLETALATLVTLQSSLQFTPEDGDYSQFGLDNPAYDLTFVALPPAVSGTPAQDALDSAQNYRLRVGNLTVNQDGYYVFLNDDSSTVYVISNGSQFRSQVLNLPTTPPLQATPTPTIAPVLNVPGLVFQNFLPGNATGYTFTNNETGDVIEITRTVDNTGWVYTENGVQVSVDQVQLQSILNGFSSINGISRATETPRASVGLDVPTYTLVARDSFASYTLQLGQQDATGAIYYGLVNAFETVVLIDAGSVGQLVSLFDAPPRPVEMTPEATAPVGEATAEATAEVTVDVDALNLTGEATPEATEAMVEMTEEVEATEAMVEMTEEVEATEVMVEMTEEADNTIAEATEAMVELPAETNLVVEDIEGENVTALTITANDGDNSDVLAFVRTDDGTWTVAEETTIEIDADLNQLAIDFAVTTFLRTTVSEGDVTADDLATVGLDAPDYEVTVVVEAPPTTDEATADPAEPIVYRVRVGSLNDERFGFYALLGEDDETVYVIAGAADIQMAILNLFDDLPVLPAEGD